MHHLILGVKSIQYAIHQMCYNYDAVTFYEDCAGNVILGM